MSLKIKKNVTVSLYDVAVMLANVHRALHDPLVGYEDAEKTLTEFELSMRRHESFPKEAIESALWSCNLLNEKGAFFHPRGYSFDDFIRKVLPKNDFDPVFNIIEEKNG